MGDVRTGHVGLEKGGQVGGKRCIGHGALVTHWRMTRGFVVPGIPLGRMQ